MELYRILDLFAETTQEIEVYDYNNGDIIYHGLIEDCDYSIQNLEVDSIDTIYEPTTAITFNVYLEEEEY